MPTQSNILFSSAVPLKAAYAARIPAGLREAAKKWNVTLDGSETLDFKYEGENSTKLGNRPIEAKTKRAYDGMFRQLWRYSAMKGDYESMLLLLLPPPKNAPSMRLDTVEEFVRFK